MVKFDFSLITLVIDQILKNFEEETSAKHGPSIEECAEFFKLFGQFIQIILVEFVYLHEVFDLFFLFIPAVSILRTVSLKFKSWDKVEEHIEVAVPTAFTQSHNSYSVKLIILIFKKAVQISNALGYKDQVMHLSLMGNDYFSWLEQAAFELCQHFDYEVFRCNIAGPFLFKEVT